MKRVICFAAVCIMALGTVGTARADISFSDSLFGVDGPTAGVWSSGSETRSLWQTTWSLLGSNALLQAFGGDLTHRLSRGIGILGGEVDEIDGSEELHLIFSKPFWLNSFEVRSLFKGEPDGDEGGRVALYKDNSFIEERVFTGAQVPGTEGSKIELFAQPALVDKLVFYVPGGTANSEFSLAKVNGSITPEPVSSSLFLLGAGAMGLRVFRRRR